MRMGSHLRWGHAYLCPSFLLSSSSFPDLKQFLNTHTHTHTHTHMHRAIFHCPSNLDSHIRYNVGSLASLPAVNCVVVREGRCDTREKLAQRGGHNAKRRRRPPKSLEAGQEGIFFVLQGLCHRMHSSVPESCFPSSATFTSLRRQCGLLVLGRWRFHLRQ